MIKVSRQREFNIEIAKEKGDIETKKPIIADGPFYFKSRQRPTLPHSYPCSTIGAEGLNFRVRNGNGCRPFAMVTKKSVKSCYGFRVTC